MMDKILELQKKLLVVRGKINILNKVKTQIIIHLETLNEPHIFQESTSSGYIICLSLVNEMISALKSYESKLKTKIAEESEASDE